MGNAEEQTVWITNWVRQSEELIRQGFTLPGFMSLTTGIETLGAFLDKKPFKSQGASKERFAAALDRLFPEAYRRINRTDFLYRQLRSNLLHLGVPGSFLLLIPSETEDLKHLSRQGDRTVLAADVFLEDFKKAAERVIRLLKEGRLKEKFFPVR